MKFGGLGRDFGRLGASLGSAGGSSPVLGQLATRCGYPTQALAAASATWGGGVTEHIARGEIVDPVVVFPSFTLSTANAETLVSGGTIKASISLTKGGTRVGNVEGAVSFSNGFGVCKFPGLTIPDGTQFYVWHLYQNANGIVFWNKSQNQMTANEGWQFGTGTATDFTVSGTPSAPFNFQQGYGPILIMGMTRRPSVCILGTSIQYGIADCVTDSAGDVGMARLFGPSMGYTVLAIPSSRLDQFNSATKTYRDQILNGTIDGINTGVPYHSHLLSYDLINEFQAALASVATAVASRATLAATYTKQRIIGPTCLPNSASTDFWNTKANQTIGTNGQKVVDANALIRAGIAGESIVFDFGAALDPSSAGPWPVSTNTSDSSRTQVTFTGSQSGRVLTASSVTGTLARGLSIHGTGAGTGSTISSLGTGVGGAGTYNISLSQTIAGGTSLTGDSPITWDGLHPGLTVYETMIRDNATLAAQVAALKR